jgi:DNA-binding beta-propeller fold protein YncE
VTASEKPLRLKGNICGFKSCPQERSTATVVAIEFLYTANYASNNITAFNINATTGQLTPILGSPFAAGTYPCRLTVDPSGQFVY